MYVAGGSWRKQKANRPVQTNFWQNRSYFTKQLFSRKIWTGDTLWKMQDFPVTQILRENNFKESKMLFKMQMRIILKLQTVQKLCWKKWELGMTEKMEDSFVSFMKKSEKWLVCIKNVGGANQIPLLLEEQSSFCQHQCNWDLYKFIYIQHEHCQNIKILLSK